MVDITILGPDIITEFGFIMDVRNNVLSIGYEEIWLSVHNLKTDKIKLIMADDTQITPNSETIVNKKIVGFGGLGECLVRKRKIVQ